MGPSITASSRSSAYTILACNLNSWSMRLITSAGSSSRSSSGCHGSSMPTRREASYLSSSFAQRTTSRATSSPKRLRTSPSESCNTPPRACHLSSPVAWSYGEKLGSPRRLTSCRIPSLSGKHPPCSRPASRSESPQAHISCSSNRPATLVGTLAPWYFAFSAADRAARIFSCKVFLWASVGPTSSSTKSRRCCSSAFSASKRLTSPLSSHCVPASIPSPCPARNGPLQHRTALHHRAVGCNT
mmetsp:Transcript_48025/g.115578  ORF Transcript_48025/g.115578 Transcript_48025/m.115578 type:complete len:243 (-) Transcript_48025:12-740(-)